MFRLHGLLINVSSRNLLQCVTNVAFTRHLSVRVLTCHSLVDAVRCSKNQLRRDETSGAPNTSRLPVPKRNLPRPRVRARRVAANDTSTDGREGRAPARNGQRWQDGFVDEKRWWLWFDDKTSRQPYGASQWVLGRERYQAGRAHWAYKTCQHFSDTLPKDNNWTCAVINFQIMLVRAAFTHLAEVYWA